MQKTYILDTNVLIQSPYALQSFEDNHIVLPLAVLEELDGLKKRGWRQRCQRTADHPVSGVATHVRKPAGWCLPSQRRHTAPRGQLCRCEITGWFPGTKKRQPDLKSLSRPTK